MAVKIACGMMAMLLTGASVAGAQTAPRATPAMTLGAAGYYEVPAANVLVFSNWYDGLFADSKISGVEIIQQGTRIATNGDVRLSSTPGPVGRDRPPGRPQGRCGDRHDHRDAGVSRP